MGITQLNNYLPGQDLTNLSENVDYNRVGDDKTDITINHTTSPWTFTIKVGSLIEKDGNQYTVDTADYTLIATDNTHNYIVFTGTAFVSGSSRGTYDPAKGGFYDSGNRVLKYYIDPTNDTEVEIAQATEKINSSVGIDFLLENGGTTSWTSPISKYYDIWVTGAGEDGGNGGTGGTSTTPIPGRGSSGGLSGSTGKKRLFISEGDTWTATFGVSDVSVTDGSTTLTAGNAGGSVTGCDITLLGDGGGYGGNGGHGGSTVDPGNIGMCGGSSFYGSGGSGGLGGTSAGAVGGVGGNASLYGGGGGAGGGGGGTSSSGAVIAGGAGGTGTDGVVRIIG